MNHATEYDVFVDKTLFIKEIIDSSEEAILIAYPRRWEKTLNLDMLKTFFEPVSEECRKPLEDKYNLQPEKQTWGVEEEKNSMVKQSDVEKHK